MKKKFLDHNHEIDLVEFSKTIWDGKIRIIFITIISILVGFGFSYQTQQPETFLNSLVIKQSRNSEFIRFVPIMKFVKENQSKNSSSISEEIFEEFLRELMDYKELTIILKKNERIKKEISKLSIFDKQKKLFDYAKLLTVYKPLKKDDDYVINFIWENKSEGISILEQTLNLVLANFEKSYYEKLFELWNIKKNMNINRDSSRIEYLLEQSSIAKELNISENQIDNINLPQLLTINVNTNEVAYYLRGYKAINFEIDLIKNRKYRAFDKKEKEINSLKATDIKWVDFNIFLLNTKLLSKPGQSFQLILVKSIIVGLLIGIFYVFIYNNFLSQKVFRKRN
tara:strand:- start:134 stop:1153 length:1020 start_codon:yes stop_codon:yes gene_type:complete